MRPRSGNDTPTERISGSHQPTPNPKMSRPFESTSRDASCLASTTAWRWGRMMTPVASRMREVWAARKVKATMGSSSRMSGAMGRPGTGGSGSTTWSATQSDSKPAASAARPKRAAASGYPQLCRLTEWSPNFIAGSP